jgi:hypothetical protein
MSRNERVKNGPNGTRRMNKRGIEMAFSPIVMMILGILVIIVLGIIFRDKVLDLVSIEDQCGEGALDGHQCSWERPEGGVFCTEVRADRCDGVEGSKPDERDRPYCCQVS